MSRTAPPLPARRTFRRSLGATLALTALLAPSCGDNDDAASSGASLVDGVMAPVQAVDNSFRPENITVAAGTEVVFTNKGRTGHNIVPNPDDPEKAEGWGQIEAAKFEPGAEYSHRFTKPGEYRYYCSLHGTKNKGMVGTITVTG